MTVPEVRSFPRPRPLNFAHVHWALDVEHGERTLAEMLDDAHRPTRLRGLFSVEEQARALVLAHQHDRARGRGLSIQAGRYAGLKGHHVEESLKVIEYDDDGHLIRKASTLDEFAQSITIYVDFGLFLFAMCSAGVTIRSDPGPMTWLILASLWIGKFTGILTMYKLAQVLGYPAPLGVRRKHVVMISLIAGLGLTVALFACEAAFAFPLGRAPEPAAVAELRNDAKLGAVLSLCAGLLCLALSKHTRYFDFAHENVVQSEQAQLKEEVHHEEDLIVHGRERALSGDRIRVRARARGTRRDKDRTQEATAIATAKAPPTGTMTMTLVEAMGDVPSAEYRDSAV